MRARLGGRFAVFFDDYSQRNGFLYKNFLEKSGALLFIVSPGSCRADSWCRYELRRFLDQAQPVAHPGVPASTQNPSTLLDWTKFRPINLNSGSPGPPTKSGNY